MNERELLSALAAARARRRAMALVTVTGGDGPWADQVGRRLLVMADPAAEPLGDLTLGNLTETVLTDVRAALAARTSRLTEYTGAPDETGGESAHPAAQTGRLQLFVDVQAPPPQLIIAGAGHIAEPLAAIAHLCDFRVTVLDDRAEYANRRRFPTADEVIAGLFAAELRRLRAEEGGFDPQTYLVLVTRGHQYDVECLLEVLDDPLAYIGMIGSKRRIRAVYDLLARERGIDRAKLERVHAPIGLPIGAQTPAEIAVCIMGEIVQVKNEGVRG